MIDHAQRARWIVILRQLLQQNLLAGVADWQIFGKDESLVAVITELQERLLILLPFAATGDMECQAIRVNRHSIERTITFLGSDSELPRESMFQQYWFLCLLLIGVGSLGIHWLSGIGAFWWMTMVLFGGVIGMLWIGGILSYGAMAWQIFQVRILRRDLRVAAAERDAMDFWPFESSEALQFAVATSNRTDDLS